MDEELNDRERAALDKLPREVAPSRELRNNITRELRKSGLIKNSWGLSPRAWALAAATLVIGLITGMLLPGKPGQPRTPGQPGKEFILFVHTTPSTSDAAGEPQRIDEYRRWAQGLRARGMLTDGQKLTDDVSTIGTGPKPSDVGGFFRIVARDRAEAEAVARTCPHVRHGGWIEVREIDHV